MWWVVLRVHVDVHGEWVMLWVAAMYNVLAVLTMADMVCLACMQKLESMSSAGSVWYVAMVCMRSSRLSWNTGSITVGICGRTVSRPCAD